MIKWLLIGIVLLGFFLRVIGLSNHPAGFTPDEASFGYDAYSILKTGKDQWGHMMPLVFKSFGDDKLPVYTYLAVPSVAIFGLNETAVRLPNAIFGTLAIIVVYFLVYELFKDRKLALFSAFLLAISSWHIMLSRGAFEANLTTFFLPLGILFFLKGLKNSKYLVLSVIIFIVNLFTYHTARILTPLIVGFLIYIYRKELRDSKRLKLWILSFALLFVIGLFGYLTGGSRVASSGIFDINYSDDRYLAQVVHEPGVVAKLFYNKLVYITKQFLTSYFSYFSPQFLFTNGPAEGTYGMVPGIGVLYFSEIILAIGAIIFIVREGFKRKEIQLLLFWVLISPIPAALTKGPGYAANRVAFVIPALVILLAIGGIFLIKKRVWFYAYIVLLAINFIYVGEKYLVGQMVNQASSMVYGTSQVVNDLKNTENKQIIISKNISEPQIYFAFYTKMDPVEYQNYSRNWNLVNGWVDQQGTYKLGKYTFRNINYDVDQKLAKTVLVGTPNDFPAELKPNISINYPNLKPAYYIIQTK